MHSQAWGLHPESSEKSTQGCNNSDHIEQDSSGFQANLPMLRQWHN